MKNNYLFQQTIILNSIKMNFEEYKQKFDEMIELVLQKKFSQTIETLQKLRILVFFRSLR